MIYPPPRLDTRALPKAEELEALHLWDLLDDLAQFSSDFECALDLFDIAERKLMQSLERDDDWGQAIHAQRWPFVPARDAAVTLYQFGWTLTVSIPDALRRCPTVTAKVDHDALRSARRNFEDSFKTHHLLRHAVGHSAELSQTRDAMNRHAAKDRHGFSGFMRGNLFNRSLTYSIDGKTASVPITRDTLDALLAITTKTFAGFAPVSWQTSSGATSS